ncbi:methyltransferase domain-containing protein [Baekduia soli]|uniref:Methyltransferase domain-containing protein n=1 Tax=Baekduia soli TaxID=496014 RepID=A0A5B8U7I1_9ACTN|nr:fused MFS/spermidine synthase [Baekduia soli]QEC49066.1 methyltransferase domain-containing protein [Baekduia soli]
MARRRATPEILAAVGDLVVSRDAGRPSGRLLRQGDMDASYVDLADPRHLEFDYLRRVRDLAEALRARRIVHIGGAGCALARALAAADGARRQIVVEVDADVLEIARAHLGLRRAHGLRIRHDDGRRFLAGRADASADLIVLDAFVGARVPRHLATVQALADAARVLAPAGALAVNVVDVPPLADVCAVAAGLRACLPQVAALGAGPVLRGRRAGNVVLVAGRRPLPLERLRIRAAADPEPAALMTPVELAARWDDGAPWEDAGP